MEWLNLVVQLFFFILLSLFIFTFPGRFILNYQINISGWANWALSTLIGFIVFTLLVYFLALLHLEAILLLPILIINLLLLRKQKLTFPKLKIKFNFVILLFILGILGQLLIIAPSGLTIAGNLVFWSAHGHDGVWHLALAQELQKDFPFQNPDFANSKLVNYHFFSDLSIAQFNLLFQLHLTDLYFRFFPLLFSILLAITSFQLGKNIGQTNAAGIWTFVFTFFAGSFGYIVTLLQSRTIGGEALFWSSQVQSLSGNPPQEIACILILAFLVLLIEYLKQPNKRIALALILIAGTTSEFKIYGAIVLLASLGFMSLWFLIKNQKFDLLVIFILSSLLAAILYLPNTSASENLLIFQPWWFIRTMVVAPDKLNWLDLELRRQTYLAAHNYLRVNQLEIEAFLIFLVGNLGMRFLGFWTLIKKSRTFFSDYTFQIMALMLLISLLLPMLFIQKGIPANTIQFFQFFLLIFGVLAGVSSAELLNKLSAKWLQVLLGLIIVLLAVPTQIGLLNVFYSRPPFAQISQEEISALNFLKVSSQSNNIILTPPFQKDQHFSNPIPPIWIWSDTSYVSALASRRSFISDSEQLDIMGYDYKLRQEIQKKIFSTTDTNLFNNLLKQNNINYLYFPQAQKPAVNLELTGLQKIYKSDAVEIWKVN